MTVAKKTTARKTAANGGEAAATAKSAANGAHDQFDTLFAAFTTNADTLRDQTQEFMDQVRANFETAQSRFKKANEELVAAAREETAEAVDFVNNLSRAGTIADALDLHREYWTGRLDAGVERAKAFAEASLEATRETFEPFSKSLGAFAPAGFEKFMPFAQK